MVRNAVITLSESQGIAHQETLHAEKQLAGLYIKSGRFEEAEAILVRVIYGLTEHFGADARQVRDAKAMREDALAGTRGDG